MYWHRDTSTTEGPRDLPGRRVCDLRGCDVVVVAETLLLLPAVQLAVRLAGLRRTVEWATRLAKWKIPGATAASTASEVERIAQLVRGCCRRWPFSVTCLDRSLVTVALLGRRHAQVAIYIGFSQCDTNVEGHAWVEYDCLPLAETRDVTKLSRQAFAWKDQDDFCSSRLQARGSSHQQGQPCDTARKV